MLTTCEVQVAQQLPWMAGKLSLKEVPVFAACLGKTGLVLMQAMQQ